MSKMATGGSYNPPTQDTEFDSVPGPSGSLNPIPGPSCSIDPVPGRSRSTQPALRPSHSTPITDSITVENSHLSTRKRTPSVI
ncbi:hypothetical protein NQ317_019595, partial [Molorchus minor]